MERVKHTTEVKNNLFYVNKTVIMRTLYVLASGSASRITDQSSQDLFLHYTKATLHLCFIIILPQDRILIAV